MTWEILECRQGYNVTDPKRNGATIYGKGRTCNARKAMLEEEPHLSISCRSRCLLEQA